MPKAMGVLLHELAQPLTALSFRLEMAADEADVLQLRAAADEALVECVRAIAIYRELNNAFQREKSL